MNFQNVGLVAAGAVGALILGFVVLQALEPMSNHDEPIIIDNGPVRVNFKSKGSLLTPKVYLRHRMLPLLYYRIWKDGKLYLPCGSGTECRLASEEFRVYLDSDRHLEFKRSQEVTESFLMKSSYYEFNDPSIFTPTTTGAKDNGIRITRIDFRRADGTWEPVVLRDNANNPRNVRIAICAEIQNRHCPE